MLFKRYIAIKLMNWKKKEKNTYKLNWIEVAILHVAPQAPSQQ